MRAEAFNLKRVPRILFFTVGKVPTADEIEAAKKFGPGVCFRNSQLVNSDTSTSSLEECDGVAGNVPKRYADVYDKAGRKANTERVSHFDEPHGAPDDPANEAARSARPPSKSERAANMTTALPPRAMDGWSSPVGGYPQAGSQAKNSPTNEHNNDPQSPALDETMKDFVGPVRDEGESDEAFAKRFEEARDAEFERRKASGWTAGAKVVPSTPQTEAAKDGTKTEATKSAG
jgi:hypothetical protein